MGIAAAAVLLGLWEGARRWLAGARELELSLAQVLGSATRSERVSLAMMSGLAEELFFRGAVQGSWGWGIATVLFAVLHTGPGRPYRIWTLFAALAGALLGGLMVWRGNLLAPVVAHAVVNGVNLLRLRIVVEEA